MQEIVILSNQEARTMFQHEEVFKYNKKRNWRPLQRLCFWILKKLGCQYMEEKIEYQKIQLDMKNMEAFVAEQVNTMQRDFYMTPEIIFMGEEDFLALNQMLKMQDSGVSNIGTISLTIPYSNIYSAQIYGIRVQVVPWMKGILAIPREMLK